MCTVGAVLEVAAVHLELRVAVAAFHRDSAVFRHSPDRILATARTTHFDLKVTEHVYPQGVDWVGLPGPAGSLVRMPYCARKRMSCGRTNPQYRQQ